MDNYLEGKTWKIETACGNLFITVNEKDECVNRVFIQLGKAGGCSSSQTQAIAELINVSLKNGKSIKDIVDRLIGIRCHKPTQDGVLSCADAIGKILSNYLID